MAIQPFFGACIVILTNVVFIVTAHKEPYPERFVNLILAAG